jgi:glycosyltransferase involved in cell wall biosynthesis
LEKKILYIGNKLSQKGITVTSIETLGRFLESEGIIVYTASSIKNKVFRLWDMVFKTIKYSRKVDYVLIDTYSTQNFFYAVAVGNVCRLFKIPYIPILRGGDLPKRLVKSPSQSKKLFHEAKVNVAPSNYLLQTFINGGFHNTICIPNTITIENYPYKERVGVLPKLLWVRSFAEIYNPFLAIQILERIKALYPIATLCMVGPDKDGSLQKCKEYVQRKNLPVTFTGKLSKEEWIELSKDYDIFLNTTNFDNTPVSVIEAMALGLPVISTKVGGIPYLLENRKDALLVPPNNKEAFVEAIVSLCSNNALSKSLVKNARHKVEGYDWEYVKHLWLKLLKE